MPIILASLGSLGDLHPILALALASRDRGNVAVIAASEPYREYIASLGFAFCRMRPELEPNLTLSEENLLRKEVFPKVRETYEDLLEAAREADFFVVGELLYVARDAGETQFSPRVRRASHRLHSGLVCGKEATGA
jgi:UDP:flavonoid glycosyltransferase YjiC (YdhE family)